MTLYATADSAEPAPAGAPGSSSGRRARHLARIDTALSRSGLEGPFARDLLLGVVAAPISVGMLLVMAYAAAMEGTELSPATTAALATAICVESLLLCIRRLRPALCLAAVAATQITIIALLPGDAAYQGLAVFIAAYTCGTQLAPRRLAAVLLAVVAVQGACGLVLAYFPPLESFTPPPGIDPSVEAAGRLGAAVFGYVGLGLVGHYVATRRRVVRLERLSAAEAVAAQQARADNAVRSERTRMARELHDIAAHHLSGMVVQAGAAEHLVGRDDDAAREAVAWIRGQGKQTLEGLRMVVAALREPGESPAAGESSRGGDGPPGSGASVPGIAVIDRLVADERALGVQVAVVRTGRSYDLPPVADVTFYRVAQEALANARDHAAGAPVHLALHHGESEVVMRIDNAPGARRREPSRRARGLGLVGMRERAQLVGAVLDTGPTPSGGWRVRLTLPFTREFSTAGGGPAATEADR